MPHFIEAAQLRLEQYRSDHAPDLYSFMRDPVAMQYTYVAQSLSQCAERLSRYEAQRALHGYAPWTIIEQSTESIIGWGGLSIDPDEPEWGIEVSYSFNPVVWGKGYATALVNFCVAKAFSSLREPQVNAFAMPGNTASVRVLNKCGFKLVRYVPHLKRDQYAIKKIQAA